MKNFSLLFICLSIFLSSCSSLPFQKTYKQSTYVSTVNIGGKTVEEAKKLLSTKVEAWKQQSSITLIYQDKSWTLPEDLYIFFIDQTMNQLQDNNQNPLIVSLDSKRLQDWLMDELKLSQFSSIQFNQLEQDIIQIVKKLQEGNIYISIKEYVDESNLQTVATSRTIIPFHMTDFVKSFVETHEQISITSYETFSLHSWMESSSITGTDEEWSFLATSLYKVVLQSNFPVLKRTAHRSLPSYATIGLDVKVTNDYNDFVFQNPNETIYTFQFNLDNDRLYVDLIGQPFSHTYKVEVDNIDYHETVPLVRFTDEMNKGIYYVDKRGYAAVSLDVYRLHYDENVQLIEKEKISHDFYPGASGTEVHGTREAEELDSIKEDVVDGELSIVTEDELKIYIEEIIEEKINDLQMNKVVNES